MSIYARRLQRASRTITPPDTPDDGTLSAPPNLVAAPNDTSVELSWTDPGNATGYGVSYAVHGTTAWNSAASNGIVTSTIVSGLTNGTEYDFRVRTVNGINHSAWSSIVTSTPEAPAFSGTGVPEMLDSVFVNRSSTDTVYAYVVGLDPSDNAWMMVSSDGAGTYKPPVPSIDHTEITTDCAIPLNAIGAAGKAISIPHLNSGRIFFSYDQKMHFYMNKNGGFVMPSQTNVDDPNIDIQWTFCEFSLNNVEIYGNISFVDMLSIPLAFKLEVGDNTGTQYVEGLPNGAMAQVATKLLAQKAIDGSDWDQCLYRDSSDNLIRILSPNSVVQIYPTAFETYLDPYIDAVWSKYASEPLTVDTQRGDWGVDTGNIVGGVLDFGGGMTFAKPSTASIWSCSTSPWTTGNDEQGNLTARITAAFNRTTLLLNSNQPDAEDATTYYKNSLTNHYSRIVHSMSYGQLGYAFPYDDVHPAAGMSYEGKIESGSPRLWTITVGVV